MNWVQWYETVWLAMGLLFGLLGGPQSGAIFILQVIVAAPVIGRIFGWW